MTSKALALLLKKKGINIVLKSKLCVTLITLAVFGLLTIAIDADAQSAVTTSGGAVNTVPLFTGTSDIENSAITQSSGNVAISLTGNTPRLIVSYGSLLLGTAATNGGIAITSGQAAGSPPTYHTLGYRFGQDSSTFQRGLYYDQQTSRVSLINTDAIGALQQTTISERFTVLPGGNVGVGTTTPSAKLEVSGNVKLTTGSGATLTFADGTVQSTAFTGVLCGGDYAESVDVTGNRVSYEPGDLLVIDPEKPGKFLKSAEAYSTLVAGVYSTKPGALGRRQINPREPDEVPMAMIGIVPTKVSTENGPIKAGDLLVTSSTVGYAMKGTDRNRLTGAVIGKALNSLDRGEGVIEVLVTLQ